MKERNHPLLGCVFLDKAESYVQHDLTDSDLTNLNLGVDSHSPNQPTPQSQACCFALPNRTLDLEADRNNALFLCCSLVNLHL